MGELKISSDLQNVIKKVVLDTYYPVGSLYLTVGSENPNTTIGGTWTKLSGYYLYADTSINNTSYTGKGTQGHAITVEQMPSHNHVGVYEYYSKKQISNRGDGGGGRNSVNISGITGSQNNTYSYLYTGHTGGGQGHSHNIATKGIYVWQRTK